MNPLTSKVNAVTFTVLCTVSICGIIVLREPVMKAVFACLLGQATTRAFVTHRVWRTVLMILFTVSCVALIVYNGINHE